MTHGFGIATKGDTLKAETLASKWLGDANEAEERGDYAKAEVYFRKAQYWLDRYNKWAGNN